jgi:hypothetical protein
MACDKDDASDDPLPIASTDSVTMVSDTTATIYGKVNSSGFISERGFCWSPSTNPTTLDAKTVVGSGVGVFNAVITGLLAGTNYFVRSYAVINGQTFYGNQLSFVTTSNVSGLVRFEFENFVDGTPIQLGPLSFTNQAGNIFSVDLLKYYISNVKFYDQGSVVYAAPNYELLDASDITTLSFDMPVPQGSYDEVRFLLGVDSLRNVSGAQSGELDPVYGMFWDWNTGYIYFKHEGQFIDAAGDTLPLVYHYGALPALREHPFTASFSVLPGQSKTIKFRFNLNKVYRTPNVVDFNNNNIHSGGANWVNTIRDNFENAFEIISIN